MCKLLKEVRMMTEAEKALTLDKNMSDVFNWSDDDTPVRDALWNYFMDNNEKNTMKTIDDMKKFEDMPDDQIASEVEKLLKS